MLMLGSWKPGIGMVALSMLISLLMSMSFSLSVLLKIQSLNSPSSK